jgi:hypothetical protein
LLKSLIHKAFQSLESGIVHSEKAISLKSGVKYAIPSQSALNGCFQEAQMKDLIQSPKRRPDVPAVQEDEMHHKPGLNALKKKKTAAEPKRI